MTSIRSNLSSVAREFRKAMAEQARDQRRREEGAVRKGARVTRDTFRVQVVQGGMDPKMAKTWRDRVYTNPGRKDQGPAALVFSKAAKIMRAAATGRTIRPRRADFLIIPLPPAVQLGYDKGYREVGGRKRRANFANIEKAENRFGKLRAVPDRASPGTYILFADNVVLRGGRPRKARVRTLKSGARRRQKGTTSIALFKLAPQVQPRRFLNVARAANRGLDAITDHLALAR